jgi:ABC-type multidrug transport system fused ATPase/permease subunit
MTHNRLPGLMRLLKGSDILPHRTQPTLSILVREFMFLVMSPWIMNSWFDHLLNHIGVGLFFCTFIYMHAWAYTAEVTSKRIRERYLKAILRQDIAFFDKVGPGEVTTRIQTDTRT